MDDYAEQLAKRIEGRLDHTYRFPEEVFKFLYRRLPAEPSIEDPSRESDDQYRLSCIEQSLPFAPRGAPELIDDIRAGWRWTLDSGCEARLISPDGTTVASGRSEDPNRALLAALVRSLAASTPASDEEAPA
jgi:hypothetical protein